MHTLRTGRMEWAAPNAILPNMSPSEGRVTVSLTGVIALDGPSVTGKSSVARTLARLLAARYLDTGAMYRAVTWAVVEGRDIGTVVAPDAELKVYLTASPEERALRRARQEARTSPKDIAAIAAAIRRRDEYDSNRPTSPLRPADDAIVLDTTAMDEDDVIARLVDLARQRGMTGEGPR